MHNHLIQYNFILKILLMIPFILSSTEYSNSWFQRPHLPHITMISLVKPVSQPNNEQFYQNSSPSSKNNISSSWFHQFHHNSGNRNKKWLVIFTKSKISRYLCWKCVVRGPSYRIWTLSPGKIKLGDCMDMWHLKISQQ